MSAAAQRYRTLDALRGIAVMGILLMNIIGFAMPMTAYINPMAHGAPGSADLASWLTAFVLIDGKMRGLFSLLFGASLLLILDRAEARGEHPAGVHFRRMGWLLLFGLAHYYLIWAGDILSLYAVIGMIAYCARRQDGDTLIRWAIGVLIFNFALFALLSIPMFKLAEAALAPDATEQAIRSYRALVDGIGAPGSDMTARELAAYRGDYAAITAFRLGALASGPLQQLFFSGLETLGYVLAGMGLLRNGFLTGAWEARAYRRVAGLGYTIGLLPMAALGLWCWARDFAPVITFTSVMTWSLPFRAALIVAHSALALWIIQRMGGRGMVTRIAAVGRAAFTNYLGTSIIMTTLFYGYGLGLFGSVERIWLYAFVPLGWIVMLSWSKPWLDRFAYGPFEWLWRSLARGAVQPMRKTRTD